METGQYFLLGSTAGEYLIWFSSINIFLPRKKKKPNNFVQEINIAEQENFEAERQRLCLRQQAASEEELGLAAGCSKLIQFANPQSAPLSWELLGAVSSPGLSSPNPELTAGPGSGCGCRGCSLPVRCLFPSSAAPQGALCISLRLAPN